MPVAALVVDGGWFALTFGLRTLIQRRRTGSRGFKGVGGRPGSLEWVAGVLVSAWPVRPIATDECHTPCVG
jgi:hypothetical protein